MTLESQHVQTSLFMHIVHTFAVMLGGVIAAYGLEAIMLPNRISDGGVTGISIMLSTVSGLPLGLLIAIINIPFLYLGYKQIGTTFAIRSAIGIVTLALATFIMRHVPTIIHDNPFLVIVSGGFLLGMGMGLALRNGGALDGTDILAVLISRKTPFSTGDIIIVINVVIFSFAVLVLGIEGAISSIISYFIATKVINILEKGFDDSVFVYIISPKAYEIGEAIQEGLGRSVTYVKGIGGYSKQEFTIINCVVNRLEESKLKDIIMHYDDKAFITFSDVAEVSGGRFRKRNVH